MNQTLEDHNKDQKEEYWEKVNEVRRITDVENNKDSEIKLFGLKTCKNDELFTITDWFNIWKWIETQNKALLKRERERVEGVIDGKKKKVPTKPDIKQMELTMNNLEIATKAVKHHAYNQAIKDLKQALCKKN